MHNNNVITIDEIKTLNPTVKVQLQRTKRLALRGNTQTRFIQKALEINFKKYPCTEPKINQFDDHRLGYSFDEREKDGERANDRY
uniref:Uncharacterized protein n=1 Tax=Trichogramma kaykai TaxID=54128 RepID=A0ABD2WC02_9HYME